MIARPVLSTRPGAIAPLTALMCIPLLAMVAFAVDTSWIVLTQSELQNAADSAVLAGAQELFNGYSEAHLPGVANNARTEMIRTRITSAKSRAIQYAAFNGAGGVAALTLLDADIAVGFTAADGRYTDYSGGSDYPNTIKVVTRRDSSANQPLSLFFAPVLGVNQSSLTATAGAVLYTGVINSFKGPSGLMPFTYDVNTWKNFVSTGKDADGNTSLAGDGNPQLQVYPSIKDTGNFGQLSLDDSNIGASTISEWLRSGPSAADIRALMSSNLIPISGHDARQWDWQGSTGLTSSNISDANDQVGRTFFLPLFVPKSDGQGNEKYAAGEGTGSNYSYNIVAFVPVKIMPSDDRNGKVLIQPATKVDANVVFDSQTVVPAGTSSSAFATVMPPRLTH